VKYVKVKSLDTLWYRDEQYKDGVGDNIKESASIFSLIQSARASGQ